MKTFALWVALFACVTTTQAQTDTVRSKIQSSAAHSISILNIFPKDFPQVSVVFKIEDQFGNPVWNLSPNSLTVTENGQPCEIVSLQPISKKIPISISLVMDHSGSMLVDMEELVNRYNVDLWSIEADSMGHPFFPAGYVTPLDKAKQAVKDFIRGFDCKKDYFSLVGFSTNVVEILPPSKETAGIVRTIDAMQADSSTALYDAVMEGLRQANKAEGIRAIVVLTDGNDNSSEHTYADAIELSKQLEIPLFIIGLGDVNKDTLEMICRESKGEFFYLQSSSSLHDIYAKISRKIQSYYDLVYASENLSSSDTAFDVAIQFKENMLMLESEYYARVPQEVKEYLKDRELNQQYMIWGGAGTVVLLAGGTILLIRRRKKQKTVAILKLYPNPVRDILNMELSHDIGTINIVKTNGVIALEISVTANVVNLDVQSLDKGVYLVYFSAEGAKSKSLQIVKQ